MTEDIFEDMGGAGGFVERLIPDVGDIAPYEMFESLKLSLACTIKEYGMTGELHCHFIVVVPTEQTPESVRVMSFALSHSNPDWYVRLR